MTEKGSRARERILERERESRSQRRKMDEVERIQEAVEQLLERRRERRKEAKAASVVEEEEEDRLLSSLLSQLVAAKADPENNNVAAELRKLRRQNTITHLLLCAMIAVTATWQFSEASLLFGLKNKLTNPFKSAGNLIGRILRGGGSLNELHRLALDTNRDQIEGSILPQIAIPELPALNLQNSQSGEE